MNIIKGSFLGILILYAAIKGVQAQDFLTNISGRSTTSLNGEWRVIIDKFDTRNREIWRDKVAVGKTDFYEYSFENSPILNVPGDWNSQLPELKYYEGVIWYKKSFNYNKDSGKRTFIYIGAANYKTEVYLNGEKIGEHEGGFTPFQFEITDKIKNGANAFIIKVDNQRTADGIPAMSFDWWNYGGITREVFLVETPLSYVKDYFVQLEKGSLNKIKGWIKLDGISKTQKVTIEIPEIRLKHHLTTNSEGFASFTFSTKLQLWSPENPKLYQVKITSETDSISESIGFRSIEVKGQDIVLNGKNIFLKGINFHEENPQRMGRAYSEADAVQLITWSKELGCNFVRLAHYPQNENTVKLAEKMGLMMWEEIPVWQGIDFENPVILSKANAMLTEMIARDKNRCGIIIWSMSNETTPSLKRNQVIADMAKLSRSMDNTRLISSAFDHIKYDGKTITIDDSLSNHLDVLAVNQYNGWYTKWKAKPEDIIWKTNFNKPMIMSEFGGEALYGNHGESDVASSWSEEFQEQLYKDQLAMIKNIPFLRGTAPWVLADFRSPYRMNYVYQNGWNRKGLISDKGFKKKAWYIMKEYYDSKP